MNRILPFLLIAVALTMAPEIAQAQSCTEECTYIRNEQGTIIGTGCIGGEDGWNCEAHVTQCGLTLCDQSQLRNDNGIVVASVSLCSLLPRTAPIALVGVATPTPEVLDIVNRTAATSVSADPIPAHVEHNR